MEVTVKSALNGPQVGKWGTERIHLALPSLSSHREVDVAPGVQVRVDQHDALVKAEDLGTATAHRHNRVRASLDRHRLPRWKSETGGEKNIRSATVASGGKTKDSRRPNSSLDAATHPVAKARREVGNHGGARGLDGDLAAALRNLE